MNDRLFSASGKSRILCLETNELDKQLVNRSSETLGFTVTFCKLEEEILQKLQQRFYEILIINPDCSRRGIEDLLGTIRSFRGYERAPVLVLVPENKKSQGAMFLDKGADGYITKPFTEDQLFSHLNLFLRRLIYRRFHQGEYIKRDLNQNIGTVVLCSASKDLLEIPVKMIETEVLVVTNENELFKTLYSNNVWIVFIGTHARWALPLVGKIKNDEAYNVQVILLRSNHVLDNVVVDFFNQGGDDITSVNKPGFILSRQINSRLSRELYFKEKYINALTTAASKLPIRSDRALQINYGAWEISASHINHDEIPGGDFYEVIVINDNQRIILIGDVMGKKWDAWFFSLAYLGYIRSAVRNFAYQNFNNPARLLEMLNLAIFRDFKLSEVFTTLSVILLDRQGSKLRFSSAGALPALLYKKSENQTEAIQAKGVLLGLNENEIYENLEIEVKPGDSLFLFTDGYLSSQPEENKIETLAELFGKLHESDTTGKLDERLKESGYQTEADDRTLVRIRKI